jgi:hypothetical protein
LVSLAGGLLVVGEFDGDMWSRSAEEDLKTQRRDILADLTLPIVPDGRESDGGDPETLTGGLMTPSDMDGGDDATGLLGWCWSTRWDSLQAACGRRHANTRISNF